jgi:hypothetical protein
VKLIDQLVVRVLKTVMPPLEVLEVLTNDEAFEAELVSYFETTAPYLD